jgi:hypothetical protein
MQQPLGRSPSQIVKWKLCGVVSVAVVLLSMIPQIQLWIARGREWNGAYVATQGDELLYSAYINSLLDGRSRKNDPFGGRDSASGSPLPESTFSIQFIPPYAIAAVARIFRLSASSAFIVLIWVAAFLAAVSVFWLIEAVTDDHRIAATGTLFVLCLGWVVGRYGLFNSFFDIGIPALHFLRRYQPAVAFPLFFVFQWLVWRALHSITNGVRRLNSVLAGVTLAVIIFSYLFLWTGALAWLSCIATLWLSFRPSERRKSIATLTTIVLITGFALIPYLYLISRRAATLDEQQTLVSIHRPDLLRAHEILGALILLIIIVGIRRRKIKLSESKVLFTASLALLPFVVFNQQILTGKAMQSFHFEIFVVNYSTLIALFITITLLWRFVSRRFLILTSAVALAAGLIVVIVPSRLVFLPLAIANDQRIPVLLRLKHLSEQDGTLAELRGQGHASTLVFSPSIALMRLLPTWTSQGTLLDLGGVDFGGVTREQRKQFFYMHLYYSKVEADSLGKALNSTQSYPAMDSSARSLVFGHERITPALNFDFKPIRSNEIDSEVQIYQNYVNSFSREEALKRPISYAVIPDDSKFDFANLDRWYERDAGEHVGAYVLYRLRLKS